SADHWRGFGLAVALQQPQAEGEEEPADFRIERGAARDHRLEPAAEARLQLAPHQRIEDRVLDTLDRADVIRLLVPLAAERQRLEEQLGLESALALDGAQNALVKRLVEPRHCRHDRWPRLE